MYIYTLSFFILSWIITLEFFIDANSQWVPVFIAMIMIFYGVMFFLFSTRWMTYGDLANVVWAKNEFNTRYWLFNSTHLVSIIYKYPLIISSLSHVPILSVLNDLAVSFCKKLSLNYLITRFGFFFPIAHKFLTSIYAYLSIYG